MVIDILTVLFYFTLGYYCNAWVVSFKVMTYLKQRNNINLYMFARLEGYIK